MNSRIFVLLVLLYLAKIPIFSQSTSRHVNFINFSSNDTIGILSIEDSLIIPFNNLKLNKVIFDSIVWMGKYYDSLRCNYYKSLDMKIVNSKSKLPLPNIPRASVVVANYAITFKDYDTLRTNGKTLEFYKFDIVPLISLDDYSNFYIIVTSNMVLTICTAPSSGLNDTGDFSEYVNTLDGLEANEVYKYVTKSRNLLYGDSILSRVIDSRQPQK